MRPRPHRPRGYIPPEVRADRRRFVALVTCCVAALIWLQFFA